MSLQNWSKCVLTAGLLSAGMCQLSAASASVLVEPRIRRGEANTEIPAPPETAPSQTQGDIVEVARNTADFRTLSSAITVANIGSVLSDEGPLTVFAPTDAAFAALPAGTLDSLLLPNNRDLLVKLLYNHVSYGSISSEQLISGQTGGQINTFDGTVNVAVMPTGVQVGEANVVQADVDASNGVIHAVDKVLLPVGFADQLQSRIDGVEAPAQTSPQSPAAVNQPVSPTAPIPEPSATQTVPAASETETADAVASPTAQPVDPSTTAGEDAPVRALW